MAVSLEQAMRPALIDAIEEINKGGSGGVDARYYSAEDLAQYITDSVTVVQPITILKFGKVVILRGVVNVVETFIGSSEVTVMTLPEELAPSGAFYSVGATLTPYEGEGLATFTKRVADDGALTMLNASGGGYYTDIAPEQELPLDISWYID